MKSHEDHEFQSAIAAASATYDSENDAFDFVFEDFFGKVTVRKVPLDAWRNLYAEMTRQLTAAKHPVVAPPS